MRKTIIKRTAVALSIALALIAGLMLFGTWYVNQEPFQNWIRGMLAERTGNAVTFQKLRVSLFPRPRLTVFEPVVKVPDRINLSVRTASIYPELRPLFSFRFQIARITLDRPEITVKLVEARAAAPETPETVFEETRTEIRSAVGIMRDIGPDFIAEISDGQLIVTRKQAVLARMSEIRGTIALLPRGFLIDLRAQAQRWGQVELKGSIHAGKSSISVKGFSMSGGKSSISAQWARFRWSKSPYAQISDGRAVISLEDIQERRHLLGDLGTAINSVKDMRGTVTVGSLSFSGPLLHSEQWKLNASGSFHGVAITSDLLPGTLGLEASSFSATMRSFSVTALKARLLDSAVIATGSVSGPFASPRSVVLSLHGRIGQEAIQWSAKKFDLPRSLTLRAPCSLSRLRFTWKQNGSLALSGSASLNGPMVDLDLRRDPAEFRINRLVIQDEEKRAVLAFRKVKDVLDLSFQGSLAEDTINRMFERSSEHHGWIRGEMELHLPTQKLSESTARGSLAAGDLFFSFMHSPVTVRNLDLGARANEVTVKAASLVWGDEPLDVTGHLRAGDEEIFADLNVAARELKVEQIIKLFKDEEQAGKTREGSAFSNLRLHGILRVSAKSVSWDRFLFKPVTGDVVLDRTGVRLQIHDAKLCGVSLPGTLQFLDEGTLLDLEPNALKQPLYPFVDCFSTNKRMDGTFSVVGKIKGKGKGEELTRSLNGWINFSAENGKIYTYPLLARIFAFLNVTELLRGKMPDMGRNGFAYDSIKIRGDLKGGKLILKEAIVEGKTLNLVADGEIDFASDTIDITVLVAPFKTLEYILSKIPLLRHVLANRLVTVPVRVKGNRDDPEVIPLDPVAVGEHLLGIMKSIIELPFKVLSPVLGSEQSQ